MSQLISGFAPGPYYTQNTGRQSMMDRNNGTMDSVTERDVNSDGSMNMRSRLDAMKPYFGVPQRQVQEDAYAWWETENYDLPDAFKGKNPYVLNIIITAILTSDMWPVTEMLPYKKNEVGMKISWDQWVFSDSMLERTPEESTSRMTTNTQTSYAQYLVRRGKAFIIEHGFWNTPMGQRNWAMNIIQIVNATTETACFGATHAIFTAPPYVDQNERYGNRRERGMVDVDSIMAEQTDSFARVQKEEGGLATVLRKMDETFRNRNGHEANYVVLPSGCEVAIRNRPENNYAIYNGVGVINPSISAGYGWTTRVSRGYRIGEHSPNVDPHFSTVCIGGFHVLTNQAANLVPISEYRTQHRTILIFSMSKDDFTPMELGHVIRHLGLYENWDDNDGALSHIGRAFFARDMTWGKLLDRAGEKDRVIEKISLMSDDAYDVFATKFNSKVKLMPDHGASNISPASWKQARTAAGPEAQTDSTPLGSEVIECTRDIIGTNNYIEFAGNTFIKVSKNANTHNTVYTWYALASMRFVHFEIPYYGTSAHTGASDITDVHPCDAFKLTSFDERIRCARVLLSVAASVVLGIADYHSKQPSRMAELSLNQSYAALVKWLHTTKDCSGVLSTQASSTLQQLLASDKLDACIHYSGMSLFGYTPKDAPRFIEIIKLLHRIARNELTPSLWAAKMRNLMASRLPGQASVSGIALESALTDDTLDPITAAVNATQFPVGPGDKKAKADKKKADQQGLHDFIKRIKRASEVQLLSLATIADVTAADKQAAASYLAGYRERFGALVYGLIALKTALDTAGVGAVEAWYARTLAIVSSFRDITTAAHFLSDLTIAAKGVTSVHLAGLLDYTNAVVSIDSTAVDAYLKYLNAQQTQQISVTTPTVLVRSFLADISLDRKEQFQYAQENKSITTHRVQVKGNITSTTTPMHAALVLKWDECADEGSWWTIAELIATNSKLHIAALTGAESQVLLEMIAEYVITLTSLAPPSPAVKKDLFELLMYMCLSNINWKAIPSDATAKAEHSAKITYLLITGLLNSHIYRNAHQECNGVDQAAILSVATDIHAKLKDFTVGENMYGLHLSPISSLGVNLFGSGQMPCPYWQNTQVLLPPVLNSTSLSHNTPRISGNEMSKLLDQIPLSTSQWVKYSLSHDLPIPLGAIGFRLHKQFDMGSAFMMDARGQAGYTYFGFADFQLGDDIGKKIHVAHFTVYLKSVIQQPKLIVFARYIISRGYFGGEGTRIYDPLDQDDIDDFRSGRVNKDILYAPVLSNFRAEYNVIDVTGKFPPSLSVNADANASTQYESADIMRRLWHLNHGKNTTGIESGCSQPLHQTLALQEHTQTWNNQRKGFTDVTLNKGHWGQDYYPGCGMTFKGEGRCLQRTIHDQTKTMTIGV